MTLTQRIFVGQFLVGFSLLYGAADAQRTRDEGHAAVTVTSVGGGRTADEAELTMSSASTLLARCAAEGGAVTAADAARVTLRVDAEGHVATASLVEGEVVSTGAAARWERCVVRALRRVEFPAGEVGTVELSVTWVAPPDPRVGTGAGGSLGGLGRRTSGLPGVSAAERPRTAPYPREQVTAVAREHGEEIQSCFTGTLSHRPDVEGAIHVDISIGPTGAVTDVVTTADDLRVPAVTECVLRRVRAWSFPAPADGATVVVPQVFSFTRH